MAGMTNKEFFQKYGSARLPIPVFLPSTGYWFSEVDDAGRAVVYLRELYKHRNNTGPSIRLKKLELPGFLVKQLIKSKQ